MLPLAFLIPTAAGGVAGAIGAGTTVKGFMANSKANAIISEANTRVDQATTNLERSRELCANALSSLGEQKLFVLNNSIAQFIALFERIKNIELSEPLNPEEPNKPNVDHEPLAELKQMQRFAATVASGAAAGLAGGALTAMGAWSTAGAFATASTGTAISSLSGAAATNATLAFFGGGAISAGGAGMAGGTVLLGTLVAGPALLAMGLITNKKSAEKLENALASAAEAEQACAELDHMAAQCNAIRRRTFMFYTFLARLDARFIPAVFQLKDVLDQQGEDYSQYTPEAKRVVLRAATLASSVKSVLDTPLLDENGALTVESEQLLAALGTKVQTL